MIRKKATTSVYVYSRKEEATVAVEEEEKPMFRKSTLVSESIGSAQDSEGEVCVG